MTPRRNCGRIVVNEGTCYLVGVAETGRGKILLKGLKAQALKVLCKPSLLGGTSPKMHINIRIRRLKYGRR